MNEDDYKLQKNLQSQSQPSSTSGNLTLRSQPRSSDYHFSMRLLATDRLFGQVKNLRNAQLTRTLHMLVVHSQVRHQQQQHFTSSKKKDALVKAADQERSLYQTKLQRHYLRKMLAGSRKQEL